MAVIQYSALVTQLRGKLGGSQFNKGHAGYTLQRKSTPTIRQTQAQQRQRQRISIAQRMWKEETAERRLQAAQAAVSNPTTDRFGQQVVLSAYNHYVKMMSWRLLVSGTQTVVPLDLDIITTPVASAAIEFDIFSIAVIGYDNEGRAVFSVDAEKVTVGTQSGVASLTRGYLYMTKVNAFGTPLPGVRPSFIWRQNWTSGTMNSSGLQSTSRQYYSTGDYVLLEMRTRNLGAGAETGYFSQLVQLQ